MSVRSASDADLDAVAAVEASCPDAAGWTRAQFASELGRPDSLFLVVVQAGRAVGHALLRLVAQEARLLDLAVRPDRRGRGLGRALLEAARAGSRTRGCAVITLEVAEGNARARRLYEALGGRVVGRRAKFYNDGADAVLMDLPL